MTPDLLADRYELTSRIAGGGMGQVWRGRDRVLQRIVAVKTVDLSGQDQTAKERFRREAVATAGLSTSQVVQVYDAGFDGDTAFLVMELLTGPSLAQRIHTEGPLPVAEGLRVAREVTRGLLATHRIGVVHRDIKPGNVMFHDSDRDRTGQGEVKLVDFGIAQLSENAGATLTAPATALGTAAYMSPEQASGRGAAAASDWYALGCLLTTMLTGQPPFTGEALAVASQQINAAPPRLRDRRPELPAALDELVARLLDKDPARRPGGAEILEQLRRLESDPSAPTMLAAAPAAPATALLPGRTPTRASFAETPSEPDPYPEPRRAPVPAAPAGSSPFEPPTGPRTKSRWPWVVVVLMLLASGVAAALSLLPSLPLPGGAAAPSATPTPTSAGTTTRQTSTRPAAPTTRTTRPATQEPTRAPTTQPPTTQPPTTQPTGGAGGSGNSSGKGNGNGNSGDNGKAGDAGASGSNGSGDGKSDAGNDGEG